MDELYNLRKVINTYLALVFKLGVITVAFAVFFLFTNLTTEIYETPKFLVLLVFTGILLVLLALKFTAAGKVVLVRTPLDIPLLLLLAVGIVSTVLSPSPYVALLGNQLRVNGSLVSIVVYILFYFVLVNNLKGSKDIKWISTLMIIAAQVLAVITLLLYAGFKIPPSFPWISGLTITPTGSAFSTTAVLALLLPLIIVQILKSSKPLLVIFYSVCLLISGLTIALTGTWASWIASLFSLILIFWVSNLGNLNNLKSLKPFSLISLIAPLVLIGLITVLSFIPPVGGAKNPLYTQAQNYPREIQLGFVQSWKIAVSAFRDSPFWGTGPSTFLFNFTSYKPAEYNLTKLWNLRLDSAFNEYLQILATLGGVGLIALLSLTTLFVSSAFKVLITRSLDHELRIPLAVSGLAFFVLLALHSSSAVVWIIGIFILASFMVLNLAEGLRNSWGSNNGDLKNTVLRFAANISSINPSEETIKVDALPGVLLTIVVAVVLFTGYFGGKMVLADYHHRLALNAVAKPDQGLIVAYNELIAAEKLNPYSDLYRTDLAQVNFALANAIAAAKGPTEASPAGSLTDQDKQNIQLLLSQSVNEARTATSLSPKSAINWEILALLYRQIAGVAQNALVFSLDSYGRAIMQDPLNPMLRVNVGGVYYVVKNYDMAIRFFTDAVNLKPDFANGYYNLSVALKDKGDLINAQAMAEKTLTLVEKDSPDYQVANNLLSELKKAQENNTTDTSTIEPPAAQTKGALQDKNLPKLPVSGLEQKPEKIATPEAVKKPSATPTTSPQPTAKP